ncbi:MAG: alpha/beta hydrolase [Candidatus Binatia bacterium]
MDSFPWMVGVALAGAYGYRRPTEVFRIALRARLRLRKFASRQVTLPDARIHYWRGGRGVPLVFVHGFGTEAAVNWHEQLVTFASDYDVIAPDMAGFGGSERLADTNCIALQVRCLRALLDDLGLPRVSLVGHSMGGWISLAFAAAHPDRVERLVVVDAAGLRFEPDLTLERALLPETIDDVRLLIRANFQRPLRLPAFVLRDLLRVAKRDAVPRTALLQRLVYGDEHVDAHLERITMPSLVVWGRHDPLTPVTLGERIAAAIPGAEMVLFENAAHSPNVEEPERFNALLRDFLRRRVALDERDTPVAALG